MPRGGRTIRIGPFTNIYRDRRGRGAWTVVVRRRGRNHSKYFSHAVWGGHAPALVAARRWRDERLRRIDPDTRVRRAPRASRNPKAVRGVWLELNVVEGRVYERYVAQWPDLEKGSDRRRFQVGRYGKKRARALAEETRKAGVDRYDALLLARQRKEAAERLRQTPPMPRQVKDPLDRKGISMAARRPRHAGRADRSESPRLA